MNWNVAKKTAFGVMTGCGVHLFARHRHAHELLILAYHGIVPAREATLPSWLLLPVESFDKQLRYLTSHYEIVPLADAVRRLMAGEKFERPTACLTFDDGYRNNLTHALPLLEKYRAPATIFLATGFIGNARIHWTPQLERVILCSQEKTLDLTDLSLGRFDLRLHRLLARAELTAKLYRMQDEPRDATLREIFKRLGPVDDDYSNFVALSWDEVRQMHAGGLVSFGGHTVEHRVIFALSDSIAEYEIVGSMREIERQLGTPPLLFAYPNGTYDDFSNRAKQLAKRSGAIAAVSTVEGLNSPATDRYELRRISVGSAMPMSEFKLATSGMLPQMRRWWHGEVPPKRVSQFLG